MKNRSAVNQERTSKEIMEDVLRQTSHVCDYRVPLGLSNGGDFDIVLDLTHSRKGYRHRLSKLLQEIGGDSSCWHNISIEVLDTDVPQRGVAGSAEAVVQLIFELPLR